MASTTVMVQTEVAKPAVTLVLRSTEVSDAPAGAAAASNPLLQDWSRQPFGLPPFAAIEPNHFAPAFEAAKRAHLEDVARIAACPEPPTFENTAVTLDRAGEAFRRVSAVFSNLCASASSPALQAVEAELAGPLAAHGAAVVFTPGLFARLDALQAQAAAPGGAARLGLGPVQARLVERLHTDFVRAGARLDGPAQARYGAILEALASLNTRFTQNVTLDETEVTVPLEAGDLDGCPPDVLAAARDAAASAAAAAAAAGGGVPPVEGAIAASLARSAVEPLLTYATSRPVRERVWRAWSRRGELSPARDNKPLAVEILRLRAEQAALHGYATFADYNTADTMAGSPAAVQGLLQRVWGPAKAAAARERAALEQHRDAATAAVCAAAAGGGGGAVEPIEPWDWRFYAEQVRAARFDFDDAALKPYLSLPAMRGAVFDVARRLFGLRFLRRDDAAAYHADVEVYEVRGPLGSDPDALVAVFLLDPFARPFKQSGAWMSEYRCQGVDGGVRVVPIVVNNCNFVKGGAGEPTLLSYDDAVTLFHEFGHGLHGMLSDVPYERLAGTAVLRDFVELPSQLLEHWLGQPEVLRAHARHHATGAAIPEALVAKLQAARRYGRGFATVEYLSCAMLDLALHALPGGVLAAGLDLAAFEAAQLSALGMPAGIALRHRLPHFQHLFSSSAYAAGYWCYIWAEVLDADAFDAFLAAPGGCFDAGVAARARACIYAAGDSQEPGAAFRAFRGRDPDVLPMLKKKLGLSDEEAAAAAAATSG